jgi:hypothetical protein
LFLSTDEKVGEALAPLEALLLGEALAPLEALPLGDALGEELELLGEELLGEELLGEELLGEELEPPEALLPEEPLLPVAPALEPVEPDAPLLAPVLCANEALASAKSAAAVAVPTTFNNMRIPPRRLGENCSANDAMSMPGRRAGMGLPCSLLSCSQLH